MSHTGVIPVRAPASPRRQVPAQPSVSDQPPDATRGGKPFDVPREQNRLGLQISATPTTAWRGRLARILTDRRRVRRPPHPAESPGHAPRFGVWFCRSRRILLTLAGVWVISVFDLGYTLSEHRTAEFVELNPIAVVLLNGPTHLITAFKFGLLGVATMILLALRRHTVAELACWFLLAAKLYVAIRWLVYFDCLMHGRSDPLIESTPPP